METTPPNADVLDYAVRGQKVALPPRPPVVRIVVLGLLLLPLTIKAAHVVAHLLPYGWTTWAHVEVSPQIAPDVRLPDVEIRAIGPGRGRSVSMTFAVIDFRNTFGEFGWLDVDLVEMKYARHGSRPSLPVSPEALRVELERVGHSTLDARVLAPAMADRLHDLVAGRLPEFEIGATTTVIPWSHRASYVEPRTLELYSLSSLLVWLLASVLLGRWLLRRHRRRLLLAVENDRK